MGLAQSITSQASMAGASGLLMLRAIALCGSSKVVTLFLLLLHAGQWALCLHNAWFLKDIWTWNAVAGMGYPGWEDGHETPWHWILVQFIYSEFLLRTTLISPLLRINSQQCFSTRPFLLSLAALFSGPILDPPFGNSCSSMV